jgi:SAM-dependent methyltransferase
MFKPQVLFALKKIIPQFIQDRIDPFESLGKAFLTKAAEETPPGYLVLDAGAGECGHKEIFIGKKYIAVDFAKGDKSYDYNNLNVVGNLHKLPFKDSVFSVSINIVVMEHLEEPKDALTELNRVIKPGGLLYIKVPFCWEEHQGPCDFFRFTSFGLRYLLEASKFEVVSMEPIGGFFWLLGRRLMGVLQFFQEGWKYLFFLLLAPIFGFFLPIICYYLDSFDKEKNYTLGYLCIAKRPENKKI